MKRLVEDMNTPPEIRRALGEVRLAAPRGFDARRGLARLRAQIGIEAAAAPVRPEATPGSAAGTAAATNVVTSTGGLWWTLGALCTAGVLAAAAAVLQAAGDSRQTGRPTPTTLETPAARHTPAPPRRNPVRNPERSRATPDPEPVRTELEPLAPDSTSPHPSPPSAKLEYATASDKAAGQHDRHGTSRSHQAAAKEPVELASPPSTSDPARKSEDADSDAQLQREIAQLAETRTQLELSPKVALRLALEGQRAFPAGMFREEREAILILALDRTGRAAEAAERAERFLEAYPASPFASRVRSIAGPSTSPQGL